MSAERSQSNAPGIVCHVFLFVDYCSSRALDGVDTLHLPQMCRMTFVMCVVVWRKGTNFTFVPPPGSSLPQGPLPAPSLSFLTCLELAGSDLSGGGYGALASVLARYAIGISSKHPSSCSREFSKLAQMCSFRGGAVVVIVVLSSTPFFAFVHQFLVGSVHARYKHSGRKLAIAVWLVTLQLLAAPFPSSN